MRRVIINADDIGYNKEISDGVIDAHRKGILTSTTLMVNMPAAEYAAKRVKEFPDLSVGIHFTLTTGRPVSRPEDVPCLVDKDGQFLNHRVFFRKANSFRIPKDQIIRELSLQIEKFFSMGLVPSHCDSHHHAMACAETFFIKLKLMKQYGIKKLRTHRGWYHIDKLAKHGAGLLGEVAMVNIRRLPFRLFYELQHGYCKLKRLKMPDERYGFSKIVSDNPLEYTKDGMDRLLENIPKGVSEICFHPGYLSNDPLDRPVFREQRVKELDFLIAPYAKEVIAKHSIELINYNDI